MGKKPTVAILHQFAGLELLIHLMYSTSQGYRHSSSSDYWWQDNVPTRPNDRPSRVPAVEGTQSHACPGCPRTEPSSCLTRPLAAAAHSIWLRVEAAEVSASHLLHDVPVLMFEVDVLLHGFSYIQPQYEY